MRTITRTRRNPEGTTIQRRGDGWWVGCADPDVLEMGPYDSRREAREACRHLVATLRNFNRRSFFTSDPEPRR